MTLVKRSPAASGPVLTATGTARLVVVLSPMFALLLGYELPTGGVVVWVPPVLGTVLFVWGGSPFLGGAVSELRARRPG